MNIYLANIDAGVLPERAWTGLASRGHRVRGNWGPGSYQGEFADFHPDVIVYAPHRRRDAATISDETVSKIPTVLWALYPDYLTGWNHSTNEHSNGFLKSVRRALPYLNSLLASSAFTKGLLESRAPGFSFEVCYLGIDTDGIDAARGSFPSPRRSQTVLWNHRWATDKNFFESIRIMLRLADKYPDVTFFVGRKENWYGDVWSPSRLQAAYATELAPELARRPNVETCPYFDDQQAYWRFLSEIDIAFSCSFHETFGIAMLEAAYAGAACVVPERAAYPEVHSGAMVVPPSTVEDSIGRLIEDQALCRSVRSSSRANAARYNIANTVSTLEPYLRKACPDT